MFDVLAFVYESYGRADACPDRRSLGRKLSAAGFAADEIDTALCWLEGLQSSAHSSVQTSAWSNQPGAPAALRVYTPLEQDHLGLECLGFLSFLEHAGVLSPLMREIVIERAMALADMPVPLEDLKIIVLLVYWLFGEEPDALLLDELCASSQDRQAH